MQIEVEKTIVHTPFAKTFKNLNYIFNGNTRQKLILEKEKVNVLHIT